MRPVLLGLVASAAASLQGPGSTANVDREIDRVVAVVRSGSGEPRVITRSRLEEETRIAIVARGGTLAATQPLDDAALAAGLEALIDETLLGDDAARLQVFDTDADRGAELVAEFRGRFDRPEDYAAFLRRWDISEEDLTATLRRKARVQRYLQSRLQEGAAAEVKAFVRDLRARAEVRILPRAG